MPVIPQKGVYEQVLKKINRSNIKHRKLLDTAIVLVTRDMIRNQYPTQQHTLQDRGSSQESITSYKEKQE